MRVRVVVADVADVAVVKVLTLLLSLLPLSFSLLLVMPSIALP